MLTWFLSRICTKTRASRVKSEFQNVASSIPCSSSRVWAFEIASVGPTFFTSTSTFRDENGSRRFLIRKPRQKFRDRKNTFWTSESRRANLTKSCLQFFIIRYLKKRCIFIAVGQSLELLLLPSPISFFMVVPCPVILFLCIKFQCLYNYSLHSIIPI